MFTTDTYALLHSWLLGNGSSGYPAIKNLIHLKRQKWAPWWHTNMCSKSNSANMLIRADICFTAVTKARRSASLEGFVMGNGKLLRRWDYRNGRNFFEAKPLKKTEVGVLRYEVRSMNCKWLGLLGYNNKKQQERNILAFTVFLKTICSVSNFRGCLLCSSSICCCFLFCHMFFPAFLCLSLQDKFPIWPEKMT